MKLEESIQPGWEDSADYFQDKDENSGTTKFNVPAVVQQQTSDDAASSGSMTVG